MWIKQMPIDYYEHSSSFCNSVMLWKNEKVYVMDNHLSAAWCWLQSCNPKAKYNFMHIDTHYDMLDWFYDEDLQLLRNNIHISYGTFENLKRSKEPGKGIGVFRNDNYIMAVCTIHPDWFHTNIFLTQRKGSLIFSWGHKPPKMNSWESRDMDSYIDQYVCNPTDGLKAFKEDDYKLPWIVNIDLDVFFTKDDPHVLLYSDEQIRHTAQLLNKGMPNIQVLTIAMSPDWIGGRTMKEKWNNAFRILKIMAEEIPYLSEFPFPEI